MDEGSYHTDATDFESCIINSVDEILENEARRNQHTQMMVTWDVTSVGCRHSSTFEWNLAVELLGVITHKTVIFMPLQETYYKQCLSPGDGTGKETTCSRITVITQMIWKSSTDKEVL